MTGSGEDLRVSSDSLESDLGDRDSLDSLDSLQITRDSLEDLTDDAENTNLMHILDKDLERVIAEATKLQSQVLESIIGNKADTGVGEESQVMANQTSELMTDAEKQIRIHRSEKETFSKGIASIIYEPEKGEDHDVDDINQIDEKHDEEKSHSVDEIIEKSQTIMLDKMTGVKNNPKVDLDDKKNKKAAEQNLAPERKTSEVTTKTIRKKSQNGVGAKKGSNFTVIGGQKVDLNTDKPQYLKLTLEQIQELAMKQKSAQLKIDDEAEHYCRIHSPTRRRKVVQDKVKTGMEKLNTLKKIEKDVEDGNVKERSNVRLTRSASVKVTSSSSVTTKGRNMTNGMHSQTASKTEPSRFTRQHLAKKVTFKSNLEEVKCSSTVREAEVTATPAKQKNAESLKSTVTKRSSSVPRWSIERPPSPLRQLADGPASVVARKTACTPPSTRKVFANKSKPCSDELKADAKNDTAAAAAEVTNNKSESGQNPSQDKSVGSKSPGGVPCKVMASDKTRGVKVSGYNGVIKETKNNIQTSKSNSKPHIENKKETGNGIKKSDNNLSRPRAVSENREIHAKAQIGETDRGRRSMSVSKTLAGSKSEVREDKKKATMVVRLHPGQHQKISANSQFKADGMSSEKWTGHIHFGHQNKHICGLEISFSSDVPQDFDIKLVPDIQ